MAIWLPYKAKPNELKNRTKRPIPQRPRYCRICGGAITTGDTCPSCHQFIKHMKEQERNGRR